MNQKDNSVEVRTGTASRNRNKTGQVMTRIRRLEEKIELIERAMDVNIDEISAVLLFAKLHKGTDGLPQLMADRFTREETNEALRMLGVEPRPKDEDRRNCKRILNNLNNEKFRHYRNDKGPRPRKGLGPVKEDEHKAARNEKDSIISSSSDDAVSQ